MLAGQFFQNVVRIGMLAGCFLGVDERVTKHDFVDASTGWNEGYLFDTISVVVQDFLRQTGGFGQVASRGAVFDRYLLLLSHKPSFRRCGSVSAACHSMNLFLPYHPEVVNEVSGL